MVTLLAAVACGTGGSEDAGPSTTTAPPAPGSGQGCLDPGEDHERSTVAWTDLENPVVRLGGAAALKDHVLRMVDGRWHLLFSHLHEDPLRFTVGTMQSDDLHAWSEARPPGGPEGWPVATPTGDPSFGGSFATPAPDLTRGDDGTYVATFQARVAGGTLKPFYRTSADLSAWSEPRPLAHQLHPQPEERMIDAALAHTPHGVFLGYKLGQTFEVARSASSSLDGPWEVVGQPRLEGSPLLENYQFLVIDGTWHVLGTAVPLHRPVLHRLAGDPAQARSWLDWELVGELDVPEEDWNRGPGEPGIGYERANSAYLCDARAVDGWWYLLYAGSTELARFDGRGHSSLGIARSRDLRTWEVP